MNPKYYDTHSHMNLEPISNEVITIVENMRNNNFITNCVGVDLPSSIQAVKLAKQYPDIIKACVGIHPSDVLQYESVFDKTINELDELVKNNLDCVVGIGEVGYDFYRNEKDKSLAIQKKFLYSQFEIAKKYNLPIMLHLRDAFNESIDFIKDINYSKVLIHCFSSIWNEAKAYLDLGCMISIPGIVTFKNAIPLKEAVKNIPIEKMVIETDSPFLTPMPYRGKTNYPTYVNYVAKEIAELKNLDLEYVEKTLLNNALNFFNWKF